MLFPAEKTGLTRAACAAASVVCAVSLAGLVLRDTLRYGVDVPFWDLWDYVRYLRRLSAGETSWLELAFARLGEHQVGMEVAMSALAWSLTSMHMPALMVWNWGTAALFCVLAMLVTRRAVPGSPAPWSVLAAACFFVFNPAAYQVWLWALPLVHLLVPLLLLAGVLAAQAKISDRARIVTAALLALAGSFLLGSGLLLWALFPFVLKPHLETGAWRRERLAAAVYAALFALCAWAYGSAAAPPAKTDAAEAAHFFLAYTGGFTSLAFAAATVRRASVAGAALLLLFAGLVALAWRMRRCPQWPALSLWLAVGVYGVVSGALTALARHGFGAAYAVESSRYVLASAFLPVACAAVGSILAGALPGPRLRAGAALAAAGLIAAGGVARVLQTPRAQVLMNHSRAWNLTGKVAVAAAGFADLPQYRNVYPKDDRADFELSVAWLNRRGWLRPPSWDVRFLRELARVTRVAGPAFGGVDRAELAGGRLRLAGRAYLADVGDDAHAVIVVAVRGGEARLMGVFFPQRVPGHPWAGEVDFEPGPPETAVRCFAYDALTGRTHLLAGEKAF